MSTIHLNVDLSFQQLLETIKQLSSVEKLRISEVLWDETMEIPLAHQSLVLGRIKAARQNPERLLDWDEASKNLKP